MPFGSFMARDRDPRPKKEKQKREKPIKEKKPVAPPPPKEEKMVVREINTNRLKVNILLMGRTISGMQEFLCSVSENLNNELHQDGLACYTTELKTITDIVARKKKLERYFWEFSTEDWTCPEDQESSIIYTLSISPSGTQDRSLDLVFHCNVFDAESQLSFGQADAVWYLADGPVLDENVGYDRFRDFLKDALSSLPASEEGSGKPVCLVLSQIEKYGRFGGVGEQRILKDKVRKALVSRSRELFCCSENAQVALIPVQVYGGMEYYGTDSACNPLLRISESGYYQSYIPENCQIPGLYTIEQIAHLRGTDFFAGDSCGGMKAVIHRHFIRKKGLADWKPDMLREVTDR